MFSFKSRNKKIDVLAPVCGAVVPIEEVNDPVFSQKMMGEGIAIICDSDEVYAPIDGELTTIVLPSAHAFGIRGKQGIEVLVHVGLETVNLKGEGFTFLKKQGDIVQAGEKILHVDLRVLKEKKIDVATMIVITNSNEFEVQFTSKKGTIAKAKTSVLLNCERK